MTAAERQLQAISGRPVRRVVVIRALHLGDLLLAVPALRALRGGFPVAEITLVGLPWATSFVERFSGYVDRFATFPGWPGISEVAYAPPRTAAFTTWARDQDFDLVVQLHGSGGQSNPFALALGGRVTAGAFDGVASSGLRVAVPYDDSSHEIDRCLAVVRALGCAGDDRTLEFPLTAVDNAELRALLPARGERPLVALHPGAKIAARRWMPERFAAVGDELVARRGARVVVTGGPEEIELAREVVALMRAPALDLSGRTSLGALAALLDEVDLFVSNDTGPAHIAAALGTPSIRVFGPADIDRWAPLGDERQQVVRVPVVCSPCSHAVCPIDHRCLRSIEPDIVVAVAERLLRARERSAATCAAGRSSSGTSTAATSTRWRGLITTGTCRFARAGRRVTGGVGPPSTCRPTRSRCRMTRCATSRST